MTGSTEVNPAISSLTTKAVASELIRMLNVEESEFDYEAYCYFIDEYTKSLLEVFNQRMQPGVGQHRFVSIIKELCQRYDAVVHRVSVAEPKHPLQFPMFTGGLLCVFIVAWSDKAAYMRLLKTALPELPYANNKAVQALLANHDEKLRLEKQRERKAVENEIERLCSTVETHQQLLTTVGQIRKICSQHPFDDHLQMFAYLAIGRTATRTGLTTASGKGAY